MGHVIRLYSFVSLDLCLQRHSSEGVCDGLMRGVSSVRNSGAVGGCSCLDDVKI